MMNKVVSISQAEIQGSQQQQDQQQQVIATVKAMIDSKKVTQSKLAKEIDVSTSVISQYLNGKYDGIGGDAAGVTEKLTAWLALQTNRATNPVAPKFVQTQTANQIHTALAYAHAAECISVVFGASGVGKTTAAKHYANDNPNVWMITASPSASSLSECLYELALELGMDDAPRRKGPLARAIKRRLMGTGGLVIIDEADHLDYATLEELRILQEQTQVGMVLVGNNRVYAQLTGGRRNEDFARLFSRIAKKVGIHKAKKNDVTAIATAWGIHGDSERALMTVISEKPGALRLLNQTLRLAAMMASGSNSAIGVTHLRAAFKDLEGVE